MASGIHCLVQACDSSRVSVGCGGFQPQCDNVTNTNPMFAVENSLLGKSTSKSWLDIDDKTNGGSTMKH